MTEQLHNSEVTFESEFQILEFYQHLVNNLVEMITSLPKNSPLRRLILSELMKNDIDKELLFQKVFEKCGLNPRYHERLATCELKHLKVQYTPKTKKTYEWSEESKRTFLEILDHM